jgi:hypothetical protein
MKLSLAFVALTAAADSQAPVISLNLDAITTDSNRHDGTSSLYSARHTVGKSIVSGTDSGKTTDFMADSNMAATTLTRHTTGVRTVTPVKNSPVRAGAQNSFADECEVTGTVDTAATHCQEPVASAYDHHDGDISTSIQTTYTLFVKSAVRKNPVKEETVQTSINTKVRGEWVITYDVQDVAGNAAEQVQFALIMIDTQKPVFVNSPANVAKTTKCTDKANCELVDGNYIHRDTTAANNHLDIELCAPSNSGTQYYIGGVNGATTPSTLAAKLTSSDNYDGILDQSNSIMSFKIQTVSKDATTGLAVAAAVAESEQVYTAYSFLNSDGFDVPKETFMPDTEGKFQPRTLSYTLYSADFADIFGSSNQNNVQGETGTVTIEDTLAPTIVGLDTALTWECGYPAFNYRTATKAAQYTDCFDDTVSADTAQGSAKITISCNGAEGLIDEVSTFTHALVANQGKPSEDQRRCLGLGNSVKGTGTYADYATATGLGKGTAHANAQNATAGTSAYDGGDEDHTTWTQVTLKYELEDTFGNAATPAYRNVTIADTIAPTLYITQSSIRSAGYSGGHDSNTCDNTAAGNAECKCQHHNATWSDTTDGNTQGDYTTEHCVQNHHVGTDGTAATYNHDAHGDDIGSSSVSDSYGASTSNAYGDELEIQHSAGYAQDYKYVQELMEEGNGYGCYDICSSTTTTVAWQTSCTDSAAGSEFNMLKPGTYYLKYNCKDLADNTATACRTFVNVDKTRPVITVLQAANDNAGLWTVEASRDNNYVDAGATCSDMVDGNISQDVEVSGDVVNMAAVGTYKINYNCEDSAGQTAVQATRTVVVQDNTCPTCTIPGGTETITVEASFPYTEVASTCTDTLDGAMPNAHIYGTVDVEKTGTYVLTYSVTDKNGNGGNITDCNPASGEAKTDHFTKTVVVEDTMIPIISLKYRGTNLVGMMAEQSTTTVNGWVIGAVASAVSGVALLGYAATRKATVATSVPV